METLIKVTIPIMTVFIIWMLRVERTLGKLDAKIKFLCEKIEKCQQH